MRIAIISTVYKKTPPDGYGGIERVVYTLTEEIIKMGHQVTLFATPGSYCSDKTIEISSYKPDLSPSGIRNKSHIISEEPLCEAMEDYFSKNPVDIIHDWSFQNLYVNKNPHNIPYIISICIPPPDNFNRKNLVACSKAHAKLCNTSQYVYYGLPLNEWRFSYNKKEHFIHIAKIASYKGQHHAILAAMLSQSKLLLAGNIEEKLYFNTIIRPFLFFNSKIKYIGEIQGTSSHLIEAKALIQTPRWFDAFPLVVLESFASGTPVIGFAEGGVKEQIVHGINGFVCKDFYELSNAMKNINDISPKTCREYAEEHFSVTRMAKDYINLYIDAINGKVW